MFKLDLYIHFLHAARACIKVAAKDAFPVRCSGNIPKTPSFSWGACKKTASSSHRDVHCSSGGKVKWIDLSSHDPWKHLRKWLLGRFVTRWLSIQIKRMDGSCFRKCPFRPFPINRLRCPFEEESSSKRSPKAISVHIAWTTACFWLGKTLLLRKWTTFGCIMLMQNAFALWHPWPLFANSLIFRKALLYPLEEGFRRTGQTRPIRGIPIRPSLIL